MSEEVVSAGIRREKQAGSGDSEPGRNRNDGTGVVIHALQHVKKWI
jgi:hypothetical protein